MKRLSSLLAAEIALVLAATLSGCSNMPSHNESQSEIDPMSGGGMEGVTQSSPVPNSGPFYNQGAIYQTPAYKQQKMCAMYHGIENARTPEEQQAMMDEQMRQMTPEMQQQHMQMMRERCQ